MHLIIQPSLCGLPYAHGQPEQVLVALDEGKHAPYPVAS